jgi:xanthine dehydrogenase accessory factor
LPILATGEDGVTVTDSLVVIKGAGDLASGIAHRLYRAGWVPVMTELAQPLVVRRAVSFAEVVYEGRATVEGVTAVRVAGETDIAVLRRQDTVAAGELVGWVREAATIIRRRRPNARFGRR